MNPKVAHILSITIIPLQMAAFLLRQLDDNDTGKDDWLAHLFEWLVKVIQAVTTGYDVPPMPPNVATAVSSHSDVTTK